MDELKNIGPNLKRIGKDTPFKVPDQYFEGFSARLNERIHNENRIPIPVKFFVTWKPFLAAAAILIMALIISNYLYNSHLNKTAAKRFQLEISQVIEQQLYSISEATILEVMDVDIQNQPGGSTVNTEDMIDYLLNEDINEEELLNAL